MILIHLKPLLIFIFCSFSNFLVVYVSVDCLLFFVQNNRKEFSPKIQNLNETFSIFQSSAIQLNALFNNEIFSICMHKLSTIFIFDRIAIRFTSIVVIADMTFL